MLQSGGGIELGLLCSTNVRKADDTTDLSLEVVMELNND